MIQWKPFKKVINVFQNQKGHTIINLSGHRGEFENHDFSKFYEKNGINITFWLLELFNKMV